ncbi:chemotaxis signal transduction protein [Paenibacillus sp. PvR052]|uniref:chemotaxis protein CheW n=1 Tax=Paenibacillus sp. PvP091 TaxID=2806590 RepID=UPI001AEA3333|nr:chemotaxis protein CheW [Paenibacillus sp. PvP091]MBP1156457.1 chemotaxis signal transduction protein [Paenibacillus sp. PvP091]MBP1168157.1 chemotaxis signal transduction protein [Paenibacillus sp. PvR098]MBP2439185.1 chemotaxis signal transduction protein [Paenibacillus sp. PvP052]
MEVSGQQFVVIELGTERYAMHIAQIYEILKMQKITQVPNSKAFMEGVTNIRGKIVPVISLRKRFHLGEIPLSKSTESS